MALITILGIATGALALLVTLPLVLRRLLAEPAPWESLPAELETLPGGRLGLRDERGPLPLGVSSDRLLHEGFRSYQKELAGIPREWCAELHRAAPVQSGEDEQVWSIVADRSRDTPYCDILHTLTVEVDLRARRVRVIEHFDSE